MRRSHTVKISLGVLIMASACFWATPMRAQPLFQRCNWGVGTLVPSPPRYPASTQVMMMPIVMDFGGLPSGTSKVAFVSFATANEINRDGGGVLRIIDGNCNEIATYPDSTSGSTLPPTCPASLATMPRLAPASGLAAGNIDGTPDIEIIALIDDWPNTTTN